MAPLWGKGRVKGCFEGAGGRVLGGSSAFMIALVVVTGGIPPTLIALDENNHDDYENTEAYETARLPHRRVSSGLNWKKRGTCILLSAASTATSFIQW